MADLTFTAPFTQGPQSRTLTATTALSNYLTGTPTGGVTIVNAGPNGAYVTKITAQPMGDSTAAALVLFESSSPTALAIYFPVDGAKIAAYTSAATTEFPVAEFSRITPETPRRLGPGMSLIVGCKAAQAAGIAYHAEWENL